MNELRGSVPAILGLLTRGIEETFSKTVGGLPFGKRRLKLMKYMEKKKRRIWRKKVNYDCRKKVADGRLRIKGKFVTFDQAREQLGMGFDSEQIKDLLKKRD
jgi:hypothetical protein